MERFIGRKEELKKLNELYETEGFHMAVIYGRRRIGKSTLLTKFIQDKKAVYYVATKVGSRRNTELLSKEVMAVLAPAMAQVSFHELEDVLSFVSAQISDEKIVFIIDEIPYWAEKDESVLSVFQKYADGDWAKKNMLFILCGSSLSFMEDKVLSEKSPLFGRRTIQIRLEPFDYLESAEFVPGYSNEDKAVCYGITGGVAKYLSMLDDSRSLDENITEQFFTKTGYLYDEARNLLAQEFSDTAIVNNIIEQIASGETALNIIADKIHEKEATVLYSLNKLISVGLVEKRHCITEEKNRKKTQYILKDQMFRFWYAFVPAAASSVEIGKGDVYYNKIVRPQLHNFMGNVFEEMCRYYILREGLDGNLNCFVTQVGTWWGTEIIENDAGQKKIQSADVDVVGLAPSERAMIVGECKFKNEKTGRDVLETLARRSRAIPSNYRIVQYLLFSRGGFTGWYEKEAPEDVRTFSLDDLYRK